MTGTAPGRDDRPPPSVPPVTVVVATRDRAPSLLRTLARLRALPDAPPVVVVDNGSSDGTPDAVRDAAPWARVIALGRNAGAGARTIGARAARTPFVAFSDDDSWWDPGALDAAVAVMRARPRVALVAAHVVVGPERRDDPVCLSMAAAGGVEKGEPVPVLGFLACAAVARREAFLAVGGYEERFGIGGEEELLAIDLAAGGWELVYVPGAVAVHDPAPRDGDGAGRRRVQARNAVWCAWLRRPVGSALGITAAHLRRGARDRAVMWGVADAVRDGAWVPARRRVVPAAVEARLRSLG
jgi:GT2 family glycosyltransferase